MQEWYHSCFLYCACRVLQSSLYVTSCIGQWFLSTSMYTRSFSVQSKSSRADGSEHLDKHLLPVERQRRHRCFYVSGVQPGRMAYRKEERAMCRTSHWGEQNPCFDFQPFINNALWQRKAFGFPMSDDKYTLSTTLKYTSFLLKNNNIVWYFLIDWTFLCKYSRVEDFYGLSTSLQLPKNAYWLLQPKKHYFSRGPYTSNPNLGTRLNYIQTELWMAQWGQCGYSGLKRSADEDYKCIQNVCFSPLLCL